VLDDAFPYFEGQVQAAKASVSNLEILDDPQRVQIVIEEGSVFPHGCVQSFFTRVAEGRMSHVVHQGEGLHQVYVQPKLGSDGAGDLGHFNRMSQAIAEVVGEAAGKNLGFGFEPAKGAGMNDAVTVPLEIVAIGMLGFRNSASAGLFDPHGVVGQHA